MYDVYITYVDKQDREFLEKVETKLSVYLHFFNMDIIQEKKDGWKVKNQCGAKSDPFVLVKDSEDKIIRAFYSESGKNAINQLIEFLNANQSKETA